MNILMMVVGKMINIMVKEFYIKMVNYYMKEHLNMDNMMDMEKLIIQNQNILILLLIIKILHNQDNNGYIIWEILRMENLVDLDNQN